MSPLQLVRLASLKVETAYAGMSTVIELGQRHNDPFHTILRSGEYIWLYMKRADCSADVRYVVFLVEFHR